VSVNSYVDGGLLNNTLYTYRVLATNAAGASGYSAEVSATTYTTGSAAIPFDQIDLWYDAYTLGRIGGFTNGAPLTNWYDGSGGSGDAVVENNPYPNPLFVTNAINGMPAVQFSSSLPFVLPPYRGTNDAAELFAILEVATNLPSSPQQAWTLGGAPYWDTWDYPNTDGTITEDFGSTIPYNIGAPSPPLTQYHLFNVSGADDDWEARLNGLTIFTTTQSSFGYCGTVDTGTGRGIRLLGGGNYLFNGDIAEILTFNRILTSDERTAVESYLNVRYGIGGDPVVISNLTATALSSSQIILNWSSDANTNFAVTYLVQRMESSNGTYEVVGEATNMTGYEDSGLTPGAQYFYRLQAVNFAGLSAYSSSTSATTFTNVGTLPEGALALWLKANALSGFTNGQPVTDWPDLSGLHNDALQANALNQALFTTNALNGEPAILFNGSNSYFTLPNFGSNFTEAEMIIVVESSSNAPGMTFGSWKFGTSTNTNAYPSSAGEIVEDFGSDTGFEVIPTQNLRQYNIYDVAADGEVTAWLNGVAITVMEGNQFAMASAPTIGTPENSFAGQIAEIMVFNTVLSEDERDSVENYLNLQYQILPSAPNAPSNLTAVAVSSSQVALTWAATVTNSVITYNIERKVGAGGIYNQVGSVDNAGSYLDTGLAGGTQYFYRIRASNPAGYSAYSAEANVTLPLAATNIPLTNLVVWLKADTGVIIGQSNEATAWLDQSGSGNDASLLSGTPVLVNSAVNGRPAIQFDGVSAAYSLPNFPAAVAQEDLFIVLKVAEAEPATSAGSWEFGSAGPNYYPASDGTIADDLGSGGQYELGNPPQSLTQYHVYNVDAATGEWTARINGNIIYSTTNNVFSRWEGAPVTLGESVLINGYGSEWSWSYSAFFNGEIAEVLMFNRVLAEPEREAVEMYLAGKYELVTNTPPTPLNLNAQAISPTQVALSWQSALTNSLIQFVVDRETDLVDPPMDFETENLAIAGAVDATNEIITDTNMNGGGGTMIVAGATGDSVTYYVNVPAAQTFDVRIGISQSTSEGIWQLSINGTNFGSSTDEYAPATSYGEVDLGNMAFTVSGTNSFTFTVAGMNAASTGYNLVLDYIHLVPAIPLGTYQQVAIVDNAASYFDTGLTPGTRYQYRVQANSFAGSSSFSSEADVTTLTDGPNLPITNLMMWLKADSGHGSGALDFWVDQSGNGNSAWQGTGANQPQTVPGTTNLDPAIAFNGSNSFLNIPAFLTGATAAEALIVLQAQSATPPTADGLWKFGASGSTGFYPNTDGTIADDFGSTSLQREGVPVMAINQNVAYDITAQTNDWASTLNGISQYQTNSNVVGFSVIPTLGLSGSPAGYFNGSITEVMMFNRALTGLERNAVGVYLNQKNGFMTVPPLAPQNVTLGTPTTNSVSLNWTALTNATLYIIERRVETGPFLQIATVPTGTTNYIDSNLSQAILYQYRIMAGNYAGDSPYSAIVSRPIDNDGSGLPIAPGISGNNGTINLVLYTPLQ
jgi:hypothetical protein